MGAWRERAGESSGKEVTGLTVKILCGDATAMLKTLEPKSVQVVVTSPP